MAKPKLTVKQAKFVKAKAQGKSGTQAYMEAYETDNARMASVEASRLLAKPSIKEIVQESMAKQGITVDLVVKPIVDGLQATKTATEKGEVYSSNEPDHTVRLSAAKTALELMGAKNEGNGSVSFNFINVAKDDKDAFGL